MDDNKKKTNLWSNASSLAMTWDFENKMTTADVGNNSSVDVTYKWDVLGRRVYRDDGTSAFVSACKSADKRLPITAGIWPRRRLNSITPMPAILTSR